MVHTDHPYLRIRSVDPIICYPWTSAHSITRGEHRLRSTFGFYSAAPLSFTTLLQQRYKSTSYFRLVALQPGLLSMVGINVTTPLPHEYPYHHLWAVRYSCLCYSFRLVSGCNALAVVIACARYCFYIAMACWRHFRGGFTVDATGVLSYHIDLLTRKSQCSTQNEKQTLLQLLNELVSPV